MADESQNPAGQPNSLGAGTSTPPDPVLDAAEVAKPKATLPGGADFDVDNATEADYKRHKEILKRRKEVADLTPATLTLESAPVPVAAVDAPAAAAPEQHDPTDIVAVHPDHAETRRFSALAWKTLETQGTHGGWEPQVSLPSPLPTHE